MFAVGIDGVNNILIVSDGNFDNPSIERVYYIGLDNETSDTKEISLLSCVF